MRIRNVIYNTLSAEIATANPNYVYPTSLVATLTKLNKEFLSDTLYDIVWDASCYKFYLYNNRHSL